jgi:hypothetical protein
VLFLLEKTHVKLGTMLIKTVLSGDYLYVFGFLSPYLGSQQQHICIVIGQAAWHASEKNHMVATLF